MDYIKELIKDVTRDTGFMFEEVKPVDNLTYFTDSDTNFLYVDTKGKIINRELSKDAPYWVPTFDLTSEGNMEQTTETMANSILEKIESIKFAIKSDTDDLDSRINVVYYRSSHGPEYVPSSNTFFAWATIGIASLPKTNTVNS